MGFTPTIPTPEQMQYLMGIHPLQVAASNAMVQAAQGPATGEETPPELSEPRSFPGGNSEEPEGKSPESEGNSPPTPKEPRVAMPSSSPRSVGGMIGPPVPPEPEPKPDLSVASSEPNIASLTQPSAIRPITLAQQTAQEDQNRTETDQRRLDQMRAKPAGVESFQHRHHILGPMVRGLEIAGSVVSPGVMREIPGTSLNRQARIAGQTGTVKEDLAKEKESADVANKEEVDAIRRQAEEDRRKNQEELDEIRRKAEEFKEQNRDITYDPKTRQFMRGGKPYIPQHVEEGMLLEVGYGVQNGPWTQKWDAEKRNQAPVTHFHVPSAEQEKYNDAKRAFKQRYGRDPLSDDDWRVFNTMLKGERSAPAHVKDRQTFEEHWHNEFEKGGSEVRRQREQILRDNEGKYDAGVQAKFDALQGDWDKKAAQMEAEKNAEAEQYGIYRQPPAPPATQPVTRPAVGGGSPQAKVATKAEVQRFAARKGLSYAAMEKQLKADGYEIQQ